MDFRKPSMDDFRYVVAGEILKHVKGDLNDSEVKRLSDWIDKALEVNSKIQMQLNILVPITLPPNQKDGFCKDLVERCERGIAKTCGGITSIHSEGGWFDEGDYVKDFHRSLTSIFDLKTWEKVSEKLREVVVDIQSSNKQKCVWLCIDGRADEINLLPKTVVKCFPGQNEFGMVDPAFDSERNQPFPEIMPAISFTEIDLDFQEIELSGNFGGNNNTFNENPTIINNHYYNIPHQSQPNNTETGKIIPEDLGDILGNKNSDDISKLSEPKIERNISYPKEKLPIPGETYSERAFGSFFNQENSTLEINFDDVHSDWNDFKRLPTALIFTFIYRFILLSSVALALGNLIGITSVEFLIGFEFLILGYAIITVQSSLSAIEERIIAEPSLEIFRAIAYFVMFPILFAIFIMPILGIVNEIYEFIFDGILFWDFKFDIAYTIEEFSGFFYEYSWAYSVSLYYLIQMDWLEVSETAIIQDTRIGKLNKNIFVAWIQLLLAGYILQYLTTQLFMSDIMIAIVFGTLVGTLGLFAIVSSLWFIITQSGNPQFIVINKEINRQLTLFKKNKHRELSNCESLIDLLSLPLTGNLYPNTGGSISQEIFIYNELALRKMVCDLIWNKKFDIQRPPSGIKIRVMWNLGVFLYVFDFLFLLALVIPAVCCNIIINGIFGGFINEREYNLTISENYFNLDHDRIKNDIVPRSNEMSSSQLFKEITEEKDFDGIWVGFAFTDFLCYASGTRHFTQKDKRFRKSKKRR